MAGTSGAEGLDKEEEEEEAEEEELEGFKAEVEAGVEVGACSVEEEEEEAGGAGETDGKDETAEPEGA